MSHITMENAKDGRKKIQEESQHCSLVKQVTLVWQLAQLSLVEIVRLWTITQLFIEDRDIIDVSLSHTQTL